jgi:hypothetical protein
MKIYKVPPKLNQKTVIVQQFLILKLLFVTIFEISYKLLVLQYHNCYWHYNYLIMAILDKN